MCCVCVKSILYTLSPSASNWLVVEAFCMLDGENAFLSTQPSKTFQIVVVLSFNTYHLHICTIIPPAHHQHHIQIMPISFVCVYQYDFMSSKYDVYLN